MDENKASVKWYYIINVGGVLEVLISGVLYKKTREKKEALIVIKKEGEQAFENKRNQPFTEKSHFTVGLKNKLNFQIIFYIPFFAHKAFSKLCTQHLIIPLYY